MNIICISGKARHGKDTTAEMLKTKLESQGKKVLVTHYGDLVKYICRTFFNWNGEKDETGRTLLQYVGTDIIRSAEPDYWVRFIAGILKFFQNHWDVVIIPDCRFPNEIEYIKNEFPDSVYSLRVERPNFTSDLTEEQLKHPSETALDNYEFDGVFVNTTMEVLQTQVDFLLRTQLFKLE